MTERSIESGSINQIKVLDRGFVEYVGHLGMDLSVVNAARVSFNKRNTEFSAKDESLLRYLAKHNHWSPFAHTSISLRIKAPISVQRQWFKHRVGVENNSESTRYVTLKPEFYVPMHFRTQSKDVKQGSDGWFEVEREQYITDRINEHYEQAYNLYMELTTKGMAREQARDILPMATYTTWVSTLSLYAAFRIFNQRTKDGAQWEISQYAYALEQIVEPLFPHSWAALKEHT